MKHFLSFSVLALVLILFIAFKHSYNGLILYTDATTTNLPLPSVTGPNMDAESADLDKDGDLDIILAREFAPNKLLFNNGNGTFFDATIGRLPQFNYDSEDIGIADFDSDNDLDIVFASEDNAVHEFYLNNGDGSFRNANDRLPTSIANSVLAQDVNNDNRPDIVLGNAGQDFILINNGDTTFTNETSTRLPPSTDVTQDMKLADIDGDNDKDLIAGNEDGNKIYINNGIGIFTDETSIRLPPSSVEETRKVTLGDIDNDSDLDIFFANVAFRPGRTHQDRLLRNDGYGNFTDVTSTNLPVDGEHTTEGIFLDIDYDNDLDLITSNIFFNRPMKVFENNGSGVFTEVTSEVLPADVIAEGIGLKSADFNKDGLMDIYLVNRRSAMQTTQTDRLLLRKDTATVGIALNNSEIPAEYTLHQNYPNPFNPITKISFVLIKNSKIKLTIFNSYGKEITTLINNELPKGSHSLNWNANGFASGIYYYRLEIENENFILTKKWFWLDRLLCSRI